VALSADFVVGQWCWGYRKTYQQYIKDNEKIASPKKKQILYGLFGGTFL
jgi:hypothetical protein